MRTLPSADLRESNSKSISLKSEADTSGLAKARQLAFRLANNVIGEFGQVTAHMHHKFAIAQSLPVHLDHRVTEEGRSFIEVTS